MINRQQNAQNELLQKLLALAGIVGPCIFVVGIWIFGLIRPGYDPFRQHISELGEIGSSNAEIFNIVVFLGLGLLMIAFSIGLKRGINDGKISKFVPILIAASGFGWIGASIFSCDQACVTVSVTGKMHNLSAIVALFGMMIAPFGIRSQLKKDPRWESYRLFSLVMGIVALICTAIMFSTAVIPSLEPYRGLIQRLAFYPPLLWMGVMAIRLFCLKK